MKQKAPLDGVWNAEGASTLPAQFITACKEARSRMRAGDCPAVWFLHLAQLYASFEQQLDNLCRSALTRQQRVQRDGPEAQAAKAWQRRAGSSRDALAQLERARAELRQAAAEVLQLPKEPVH